MSKSPPHKVHNCSLCSYTTNKKYNLERHIGTVHISKEPKVAEELPKVAEKWPKVASEWPKVAEELPKVADSIKCEKCFKTFTKQVYLTKHIAKGRCKEVDSSLTCEICKVPQTNKYALCRHRKECKKTTIQTTSETTPVASNIGVQNNINTQNNIQTQNNITNNILVFPMTDEQSASFDFITDHIDFAKLHECIRQKRPRIGFNHFVTQVLENPQNRNVQKTNMKDKYSKVYAGDDNWQLALDCDIYPTMTHHMTTAALDKMEKHRKEISQSVKMKAAEFVKFIDHINTTDEGEVYNEAVERIKLILVNLCNLK